MPRWVLLLVAILWGVPLWGQGQSSSGVRAGSPLALARPGTKAVVLFFVASDCPISNRTFPEMKRLREEFESRGVRFWYVYANATERTEDVQRHQATYDSGGDAVMDVTGELAHIAGATVTPEASVLVTNGSGWRPVYTGRIDDRYVQIGVERPQATEHFAENAVKAVFDGRRVETATGSPVGCSIVSPKAVRSSSR
jgi:hypothetical protein